MSTGRTTDDRDLDRARHKEIMGAFFDANQRLVKIEQRLERLEMEALRPKQHPIGRNWVDPKSPFDGSPDD